MFKVWDRGRKRVSKEIMTEIAAAIVGFVVVLSKVFGFDVPEFVNETTLLALLMLLWGIASQFKRRREGEESKR